VTGVGVGVLGRGLRRRLERAGLTTTDDYAGLDEAGAMDEDRLVATLRAAAARGARTLEVNTHPGVADDPHTARFAWGYRWADELAALTSARTRAAVEACGYRLTGFAGLGVADAGGRR